MADEASAAYVHLSASSTLRQPEWTRSDPGTCGANSVKWVDQKVSSFSIAVPRLRNFTI